MKSSTVRVRHITFCSTVTISVLCLTTAARAQSYSDIYIFGDSLSDTGNVLARTFGLFPPDPPYYDGRFSDGPVWVEYLAAPLELVVVANGTNPQNINGNNFAFGGAEAANDVPIFPLGVLPSVQHQVEYFVSAAAPIPADALYVVWGGGNDVRYAADPASGLTPEQQQQVIQDAVDAIADAVTMLAIAGAQEVLVPNLPDLGVTPEAVVDGHVAESTFESMAYNSLLAPALTAVAEANEIEVIQFDTIELMEAIIDDAQNNNGQVYGITNVDTPIAPGLPGEPREGPAASDPSTALWADDIHPSTAAHALLGSVVFDMLMGHPADFDGNGHVDAADLALLLGAWGPCPACPADLNQDGNVDAADLALLLGGWG